MNPQRVAKFALSGGFAAIVHSAAMYGFTRLGIGPHLAFFFGFAVAVLSRYFVDRLFVFEARNGGLAQFGRYALACAATYAVSATLFALLLEVLSVPTAIAFVGSTLLTTLAGYGLIGLALGNRQSPS